MLLADDIECFWLAGPSSSGSSDQAATPLQLDRTYSHGSSAPSRAASLAQSVGRHPSTSEGEPGLFAETCSCFSLSCSSNHTKRRTAVPCQAMQCMVLQPLAMHCNTLSKPCDTMPCQPMQCSVMLSYAVPPQADTPMQRSTKLSNM